MKTKLSKDLTFRSISSVFYLSRALIQAWLMKIERQERVTRITKCEQLLALAWAKSWSGLWKRRRDGSFSMISRKYDIFTSKMYHSWLLISSLYVFGRRWWGSYGAVGGGNGGVTARVKAIWFTSGETRRGDNDLWLFVRREAVSKSSDSPIDRTIKGNWERSVVIIETRGAK